MIYLTKQDILTYIKDEQLDVISSQNANKILRAELAAKEEMSSYLSARYDVAKIFFEVPDHVANKTYNEGQFVNFEYEAGKWQVYIAKIATSNAPDNTNDWEVRDDRNSIIVMFLCDITIYHLFTAINPRNIPELRGIRYEAAITWLKSVQKMQANPNLPLLADDGYVSQIKFGGNEPRVNQF